MSNGIEEASLHMVLCSQCGRHAHFSRGDKQVGDEFFCQNQAEELANILCFYISRKAFASLIYEIRQSGLPMEISHDMEVHYESYKDLQAYLRTSIGGREPICESDDTHRFLQMFHPGSSILR